MFRDETALGNKWAKAAIHDGTHFGSPACQVGVEGVRTSAIGSLQYSTYLIDSILRHLPDPSGRG